MAAPTNTDFSGAAASGQHYLTGQHSLTPTKTGTLPAPLKCPSTPPIKKTDPQTISDVDRSPTSLRGHIPRPALHKKTPRSTLQAGPEQGIAGISGMSPNTSDRRHLQQNTLRSSACTSSPCEDGDQIAVPAGASWQLYQLNSDAYPTCAKTALAEYKQLKVRESLALLSQGRAGCTRSAHCWNPRTAPFQPWVGSAIQSGRTSAVPFLS